MKQIMDRLQSIANEYPEVSVIDVHAVYSEACRKVYTKKIMQNKIVLKHFLQDEILDGISAEITERYFRMENYKRLTK